MSGREMPEWYSPWFMGGLILIPIPVLQFRVLGRLKTSALTVED